MTVERHSTDGDLIALLDGEAGGAGADVVAHVDTCPACSARLALLQQRAARVGQVLRATQPPAVDRARLVPAPDRLARALRRRQRRVIWSHPGLRAAAGILLVAGVAAASPARGWIVDRVTGRRVSPTSSGGRSAIPNRTLPAAPAQARGSIVWFTPGSEELVLRFDARPAGGTLAIVAGEDPRSSARIVAGGGGEAFLVLPSELRMQNVSRSVADYEVILAPAVRRVRIRLGEDDAREIAVVDVTPGLRRTIELAPRAARP